MLYISYYSFKRSFYMDIQHFGFKLFHLLLHCACAKQLDTRERERETSIIWKCFRIKINISLIGSIAESLVKTTQMPNWTASNTIIPWSKLISANYSLENFQEEYNIQWLKRTQSVQFQQQWVGPQPRPQQIANL